MAMPYGVRHPDGVKQLAEDLTLSGGEVDKAKRLVAEDRQRRVEACTKEIMGLLEPVLSKHRCILSPRIVFVSGKVQTVGIEAVAVD